MRKILIIVAAVVVVLAGCAGVGGYRLYRQFTVINKAEVTQGQFDALKVGQPEGGVRQALPVPLDAAIVKNEAAKKDVPPGATCIYYLADKPREQVDQPLFRFCFKSGRLADKRTVSLDG